MVPSDVQFTPDRMRVGNGPIYGKYLKFGSNELDESYFPITWREDGYRTPGLDAYVERRAAGQRRRSTGEGDAPSPFGLRTSSPRARRPPARCAACGLVVRILDAAAGADDVLDIRLHREPGRHLRLIGEFQQFLGPAHRQAESRSSAAARLLTRARPKSMPAWSLSRPGSGAVR